MYDAASKTHLKKTHPDVKHSQITPTPAPYDQASIDKAFAKIFNEISTNPVLINAGVKKMLEETIHALQDAINIHFNNETDNVRKTALAEEACQIAQQTLQTLRSIYNASTLWQQPPANATHSVTTTPIPAGGFRR